MAIDADNRNGSVLVEREDLSVTYGARTGGERVTKAHVHQHTEAFYVLEGELTFEVGAERETITLDAGGFVAVPPGVAHAYATAGDRPARWLVIHAPDGGFASFLRGVAEGVEVEWDIAPVPPGGGLTADHGIVRPAAPRRAAGLVA
jgi:mannose-6-phosphate isomerase-like protein (cupin superfamily)